METRRIILVVIRISSFILRPAVKVKTKLRFEHAYVYYTQALEVKLDVPDDIFTSSLRSNRALVSIAKGTFNLGFVRISNRKLSTRT